METWQKEIETEMKEFSRNMYKLLESQKTSTENIKALSLDVKQVIESLPQFARVDEKYKSMDKRLQRIEGIFSWGAKIAGGAVIVALLGTVIVTK